LVIVPGNDSPSTPRFEGLPLFSFDPCVIRGKTIEINNDVAAFNTERIISSSPAMDIVPTPSFSCKALLRSQISEERPMPSPANSVQSI
jgi:hypothetical protein